jgi:hypothetical protein
VGEFLSDGSVTTLEWDVIAMAPSVFTDNDADSVEECQAACSSSTSGCQYFLFVSYNTAGAKCKLRLTGAAIAKLEFIGEDAPAAPLLFFEVKESLYTAYAAVDAADALAVGTSLHTYTAFEATRLACNADASCVGFAWTGATWRTFAGTKWEGATGKVRVVGETLNSWIAEPDAN